MAGTTKPTGGMPVGLMGLRKLGRTSRERVAGGRAAPGVNPPAAAPLVPIGRGYLAATAVPKADAGSSTWLVWPARTATVWVAE